MTDTRVEFRVSPDRYRHWKLSTDGPVATLAMDVDEQGGLVPGYELKLNSYDLGVDIELYDATQRLRFEHPEVRAVVITSARPKIFCAGANIRMLAASPHGWKVNLQKFTFHACGEAASIRMFAPAQKILSLVELPPVSTTAWTSGCSKRSRCAMS